MSTLSIQNSINASCLSVPSNLSISASSSSSNDEKNHAVLRTEAIASSSMTPSVSVNATPSLAQENIALGSILSFTSPSLLIGTSSASSGSSAYPIVNNQDEIQITQDELNQWIATNHKIEILIKEMLNLLISSASHSHSVDIRRQERIKMEEADLLTQKSLLARDLNFLEKMKQKGSN